MDAGQTAGGNLPQILTEPVAAIVVDGNAVFYNLHLSQGHAVAVELRAADAALQCTGHGQLDSVAGGLLLEGISLVEDGGVAVYRGVVQGVGNGGNQSFNLLLVENHLAVQGLLGLDGFVACLYGGHPVGNLLIQNLLVKVAEIVLLIQLHTLLPAVVGGDGLHHGIVPGLALLKAPAVGHGLVVPVHKYLHGVEGAVGNPVGIEHRIGHHRRQSVRAELGEIALHIVFPRFLRRERIGLVANQQRLLHSFVNLLLHLCLSGRGVDRELCIAQILPMGGVYRHIGVAGIGAADGFQLALDKEHFIALFPVNIDFIIGYPGVLPEQKAEFFHPSFTLTFRAGPPSLTRTHSL